LLDFGMSNIAQQNIQIRVNIRLRRARSLEVGATNESDYRISWRPCNSAP
jgi:hypothetical protein